MIISSCVQENIYIESVTAALYRGVIGAPFFTDGRIYFPLKLLLYVRHWS